jgi:hypothetical protein
MRFSRASSAGDVPGCDGTCQLATPPVNYVAFLIGGRLLHMPDIPRPFHENLLRHLEMSNKQELMQAAH